MLPWQQLFYVQERQGRKKEEEYKYKDEVKQMLRSGKESFMECSNPQI